MRVGVVYLGRRGPGGSISLQLAKHLAKQAEVFCVVSEDADLIHQWRNCGLPLLAVPTFRSKTAAMTSYLNRGPAQRLASAIAERLPDVLVYPMVHPWTPRLQSYLQQVPDVVVVHDPIAHPGFFHRMSGIWEQRAARNATRCVVLGRVFVDTLVKRGIPNGSIDVIPHGIFSQHVAPAVPTMLPEQSPTILFFGRITEYKGLEVLLKAFQRLVKDQPDIRLKIVGDGSLKPYQSLLAATPNVIVINRWVDDAEISSYFHSASMIVLPYTSASQSGVIATAAAFRTPVVATRVGAISEQIEDRHSGLLVAPNSVDQLYTAISTLLDDPLFARGLGRMLFERTNESANWDRVAESFLETCRKAMDRHAADTYEPAVVS
jgi:glycosyltransferase involved in cell wall biosynthesis